MERDDIIEYSLDAHHSEEAGKKIRKKIWFVTALLTIITAVEVYLGIEATKLGIPWSAVKLIFIVLTVIKAGYIVMVFMHLGEERKGFKMMILLPYILFILYLLFICLAEGLYIESIDKLFNI